MKYDRTTRWLHVGIAFGVSAQLMLSLMMDTPRLGVPAVGMGDLFFLAHRFAGLGLLLLLSVHWLWQFSGRASNGMKVLFPWLFQRSLSVPPNEANSSIRTIKSLRVVAGAVQGLGLLLATLMAITGLILFFGLTGDGGMSAFASAARDVHGFTAIFLWVYLAIHLALSLL